MLTNIRDAICDIIASSNTFKTSPIHVQNTGKGFTRPSFYISFVGLVSDDLNNQIYNDNVSFQIVYFCPVDDHQNVLGELQLSDYQTLRGLFTKGYIVVGDRAPKISRIEGGPRDNEIYLTLNFDYTDVKATDDTTDYDLMDDVNIDYNKV